MQSPAALRRGGGSIAAGGSRPPVSLTSLVGRERELRDLEALVAARRLLTITGVGGAGKTRLAAELALRMDWRQADSVAWVALASCDAAPEVAQQIAIALALRPSQNVSVLDSLLEALREREMLLVLDDCERLVDACAELARTLLVACPKLRILATSREPLGVAGEHIWPVPPIAEAEAVQLFNERATAADSSFSAVDDSHDAIVEICRRLDGIPLAIELAAARVRVLSPRQIAEKLENCFSLLAGGTRGSAARHRTLRAAIDWSFDLLSPKEQELLAQLSVFSGSFSLESAEQICEADLDLLTGLVDKSLVGTSSRRASVRYSLLETIRQYAAERLAQRGTADEIGRRHALGFLELVRRSELDPMGDILAQLDLLDAEHDNIRTALAWGLQHDPDGIALPLAASFRWYWYYRIQWCEGLEWLARVIARSSRSESRDRAAVVATAGTLAGYRGELERGRIWLEEAASVWRALGARRELAMTLAAFAQLQANDGDLEGASAIAAEAMSLARTHGTAYEVAYCLTNGEAFVAARRGALEEADRALAEAEEIWSPTKHPLGMPFVLNARAMLALRRNDPRAAARFARMALSETRTRGEIWFSSRSFRILAMTSADAPPRASRLLGVSEGLLRKIGARVLMHERDEHDRLLARLRETMTSEDLDSAMREGAAMSFEEACDFALEEDSPAVPQAPATELHVSDLGPLQLTLAGQPLTFEGRASNRTRELLVFILSHPPGPTKEEAGVAFWPEATTDQVKNAFHVTLHRLRKLLGGPESVVADGARYRIALPHVTDSQRFESMMTAALRTPTTDATRLEQALALYHGDFLQGEDAGDWCLPIRARLRQLYLRGLFALGQVHEARGRYTDAAEAYTRLLAREPFHEAAARQLMICSARLGKRSESLVIYRELEERLRNDLDAVPEPETMTLYRRLRQNETV